MTQTTYSIHEIADQFARLFPDQVDATPSGNGLPESGYQGHDHGDEPHTVGWYTAGGNAGHPVMDFRPGDLDCVGAVLAKLEPGRSVRDVERTLTAAGLWFEARY